MEGKIPDEASYFKLCKDLFPNDPAASKRWKEFFDLLCFKTLDNKQKLLPYLNKKAGFTWLDYAVFLESVYRMEPRTDEDSSFEEDDLDEPPAQNPESDGEVGANYEEPESRGSLAASITLGGSCTPPSPSIAKEGGEPAQMNTVGEGGGGSEEPTSLGSEVPLIPEMGGPQDPPIDLLSSPIYSRVEEDDEVQSVGDLIIDTDNENGADDPGNGEENEDGSNSERAEQSDTDGDNDGDSSENGDNDDKRGGGKVGVEKESGEDVEGEARQEHRKKRSYTNEFGRKGFPKTRRSLRISNFASSSTQAVGEGCGGADEPGKQQDRFSFQKMGGPSFSPISTSITPSQGEKEAVFREPDGQIELEQEENEPEPMLLPLAALAPRPDRKQKRQKKNTDDVEDDELMPPTRQNSKRVPIPREVKRHVTLSKAGSPVAGPSSASGSFSSAKVDEVWETDMDSIKIAYVGGKFAKFPEKEATVPMKTLLRATEPPKKIKVLLGDARKKKGAPRPRKNTPVLECEFCNAKFVGGSYALLRHQKYHCKVLVKDTAIYKCSYQNCGATSKEEGYIDRHERYVHRKEIVFKCPHCVKYFATNSNMWLHIRRTHPQEYKKIQNLKKK